MFLHREGIVLALLVSFAEAFNKRWGGEKAEELPWSQKCPYYFSGRLRNMEEAPTSSVVVFLCPPDLTVHQHGEHDTQDLERGERSGNGCRHPSPDCPLPKLPSARLLRPVWCTWTGSSPWVLPILSEDKTKACNAGAQSHLPLPQKQTVTATASPTSIL